MDLSLSNVSAGYTSGHQIIKNISFNVKAGEVIALIGPNGSGKSTLLNTIYGLTKLSTESKIFVQNNNINHYKTKDLLFNKIVYIPQRNNIYDHLSVYENIQTSIHKIKTYQAKTIINETLRLFPEIHAKQKTLGYKLSGGQKQLLAVCMGIAHKPKILLLDEPTSGLDTPTTHNLLAILQSLNKKYDTTLLIAEHRLQEIGEITDRFIGMKLGRIHGYYSKNLNDAELRSLYL